MADLIATASARQKTAEDLRKSYTYKQTETEDEFDSHGNKKGTHSDLYQVWMVKDVTVREHLEHDGKPLADNEARKEHERLEKQVASIKDGSYKQPKGGVSVNLSASALMKKAVFSNERRIDLDGRPTIVFDYHGDPNYKAADLGDEIIKRIQGEIWIDEQEGVLRRLKGTLDQNFHVAGGLLVNVKAGSWFDVDTMHVNEEIWFFRHLQAHADGRFLLFKGFSGDINLTFSDYRKMQTSITIKPGSQVIGPDGKPMPDLQVEPEQSNPPPPPSK